MKVLSSCSMLIALCGIASAGGKPIPGVQHQPPLFVDESDTWISIGNTGDGYIFEGAAAISAFDSADRVRMDWKQGGKLLGTAKCQRSGGSDTQLDKARCRYDGKPLKAKGAVEAELVYEDDKDDKEYLLRTYKVTAQHWDNQSWQIVPDDLIGAAYVFHNRRGQMEAVPRFRFWVSADAQFDASFRCTVNGKKLPDMNGSSDGDHDLSVDIIPKKGERKFWRWQHADYTVTQLHYGPKPAKPLTDHAYLIDNPGAWQCQLRKDGVAFRELRFSVDAKGMIESHPMQQGKGAAPLAPLVSLIDIRIPKDAGFDRRIKPDMLKKSRGFGLPWPEHASVKEIHAALPPAVETMHPQPAASAKGTGKVLSGPAQSPPRFLDESTTVVRLSKTMGGYRFGVSAEVGNVPAGKATTYRVEWKAGTKVLATANCNWGRTGPPDRPGDTASVTCGHDGKPLTATGAIEASLIQHDDNDGNDYLIATFKVKVAKLPGDDGGSWLAIPDDVLAAAWARNDVNPSFWFWVASDKARDIRFRCTVNGTKIPDFDVAGNTSQPGIKVVTYKKLDGPRTEYVWEQQQLSTDTVKIGVRTSGKPPADRLEYMGDYPGAWDCMVRSESKPIRQLLFTINNKGEFEADPAQPGPHLPLVVPIDLRIPKDSKLDVRVRPDAMKKSRGWGLPWPKPPTKPFPPSSGLPDPK